MPCWSTALPAQKAVLFTPCWIFPRGRNETEDDGDPSRGEENHGHSAHRTPDALSLPTPGPNMQKPGGQGPPGGAPGTQRGVGEHPLQHLQRPTEGAGGGGTGKMWQASCLLIHANKYANDESRNALLTFQFSSSNPGGKSL